MKRIFKGLLGAMLLLAGTAQAAVSFNTPLVHRSQSVNAARDLVAWQDYINRCGVCEIYGAAALTIGWDQSFRGKKLAECLFGQDSIRFAGSRSAVARDANTVLADYFGLPLDFDSTVKFCPRVQNFSADFSFYLGLDEFWEGLYFKVNAPVVHTRWDLREVETIAAAGTLSYPEGYYSTGVIARAAMNDDVLSAWAGGKTVGDLAPLTHAKVNGRQTDTRLSDIFFALGWNFFCDECYHVGINVRVGAPTGTTPTAEFLFEPIVGDYKRWNLGGGLSASAILWNDDCNDSTLGVYLDANITHLFRKCMKRTFDLKSKTGSRYMPVLESSTTTTNLFTPATAATRQYTGTLHPFANISTIDARISAGVQADIALKFGYKNCGLSIDLGYNLWARSKEKLDCDTTLEIENIANFSLKGDAALYGFAAGTGGLAVDVATRLSPSQSAATLFAPQLLAGVANITTAGTYLNANVDTPVAANETAGANQYFNVPVANASGLGITRAVTATSEPMVLLANSDIDSDSGLSGSALSHKIFGHISYAWEDECAVDPFIGVGASVEFGRCPGTSSSCSTSCDNDGCTLSQWRVELKGGIAF